MAAAAYGMHVIFPIVSIRSAIFLYALRRYHTMDLSFYQDIRHILLALLNEIW